LLLVTYMQGSHPNIRCLCKRCHECVERVLFSLVLWQGQVLEETTREAGLEETERRLACTQTAVKEQPG
jgi:hypothetical protein